MELSDRVLLCEGIRAVFNLDKTKDNAIDAQPRALIDDRNSRLFWLGSLLGCALLHASLSACFPRAAWTTPTGVGAFCVLAMALSLAQARRESADDRWRWFALASVFVFGVLGYALLAYLEMATSADFAIVQPDAIVASAKYVPLLFLLNSGGDADRHRVFRWIDVVQAAVSIVLIVLLLFPTWLALPGQALRDEWSLFYREMLTGGITLLAISSLFYKTSPEHGRIILLVTILLTSSFTITSFLNHIVIPHTQIEKGSMKLMPADLPYILFVGTTLYLQRHPIPGRLRRWPFANDSLLMAPAGFTTFLLLLAFLISYRNPLLGLWAGLATFSLFAIRASLLQTRYVQAQAERARIAGDRAEFLANISHDIRSPLTSVALSAATLRHVDASGPEHADLTQRVQTGCEHVIDLLDDMLTLSHIEARSMRVVTAPFDAVDMIDAAIELLRPQAIAAALTLRRCTAVRPGEYPMIGEAVQVRRVLVNLLTNAVRFTPSGGVVTVSCTWRGWEASVRRLRITVADTGVGIPHDQQARLFGPLRETREPINGTAGSGLGLAIARAMAQMMGGALDFESAAGRGSRFWVDLPALPTNGHAGAGSIV